MSTLKKKVASKSVSKPKSTESILKKTKTESKIVSPKLSLKKPMKKSEIVSYLSESTGVVKKDVSNILSVILDLVGSHLSKKGPGEINFAGLFKCRVVHKAATKAREGIDPFTGKPRTFAAKPARSVIRMRPLKKLKEVVN